MAVDREALAEETITTLAKVEIWGAIDVTKQGKYIVGVCVCVCKIYFACIYVFKCFPTRSDKRMCSFKRNEINYKPNLYIEANLSLKKSANANFSPFSQIGKTLQESVQSRQTGSESRQAINESERVKLVKAGRQENRRTEEEMNNLSS